MVCDCVLPTKEEYLAGQKPCGDDCLNRMLFIEWLVLLMTNAGRLVPNNSI